LALTSEPAAFAALARGNSDLSSRASTVLARVTWPGKPAEPGAAPVAPLTPEQQKLYDTGQTLFNSLCMACHGDDGKGRTGLGPSLVGSQFALAAPVVPIRILLQGKEGSVGLMPPLGATLTDDQIAGALTFVRRQWGNAAGPVDPNTVKEVRSATAARTRPWTNDELTAIGAGRGGQAPR
jgi:mono/diheme cytochrome c family protein